MSSAVAKYYDLMDFLASLGQEKFWRRATRRVIMARPGMWVPDAAAGTGAGAIELVRAGAEVVAVGFSQDMIYEGQVQYLKLDFQQADAMNLKFADSSFGAVAISFELHDAMDPDQALHEFYRVLRPDGRLVVYELSRPIWAPLRALYWSFLGAVLPPIARLAFSDAVVYDYLAEPILVWPSQYQFAAHLRDAGFEHLQLRNLTGGIVTLHHDHKFK